MYVINYSVSGVPKRIECKETDLNANLEIARSEADAEPVYYDDGFGEPVSPVTTETLLNVLLGGDMNG